MSYTNYTMLPERVPANHYRFEAALLGKDLYGNVLLSIDDEEVRCLSKHAVLGYQDVMKAGKSTQTLCVDLHAEVVKAYGLA